MNKEDIIKDKTVYYNEARRWYYDNYLPFLWESNYLLYILIILSIFVFFIYSAVTNLLPLNQTVPFVLYSDNIDPTMQTNLKKLVPTDKNSSMQNTIAEYLISSYVVERENYNFTNLANQSIYMKNNSSYQVFQEFNQQYNIKNKDSPILKYKNNILINAKIENITIKNLNNITSNAIIDIVKKDNMGNEYKEKVYISYQLSDIYLAFKKSIPLEFLVIDYEHIS